MMKVLDLFAGAGGFSLGFQLAGYEIVGAIELDEWAAKTFQFNHPNAKVLIGDITSFSDEFVLAAFEKPDIILGGPPCQGFSICNKNAGDPADPRNSLFTEMIRFGRLFSPQCIIMENVPNLLNAKTKNGDMVIHIIVSELEAIGYHVRCRVLEATSFGVPQIRKRLFVIASRCELKQPFPLPTHGLEQQNTLLKTPTLWEAISDLPIVEAREGAEEMEYTLPPQNDFQRLLRKGSKKVYNHKAMNHSKRMVERFSAMEWGQSVADVPAHLMPYKRNGNGEISEKAFDQNNRRMFPDAPCHTIPASFYANFVHPYRNRNFTAREGARIQTFPDWYIFKGKPTVVSQKLLEKEGRTDEKHLCQYNQIGNAVPPLLSKAIAENLKGQMFHMFVHRDNLIKKINDTVDYNDDEANTFLREILDQYNVWHNANMNLKGPFSTKSGDDTEILRERVKLFNEYKDFIDQQQYAEKFDSRSNLHSSVLEEFIYYLFKDLVQEFSESALIGKSHTFKDIFFMPKNYREMVAAPCARIERKDHDFVIGVKINADMTCEGSTSVERVDFQIPVIAIECKTYLDKTMLEGASAAGEQLKSRSPNALYIVVAEWLKLTENVNIKKYKVDQIYILRKQKNTDRKYRYLPSYTKNPIHEDVVQHLFETVRKHLTSDWEGGIQFGLERGYLL